MASVPSHPRRHTTCAQAALRALLAEPVVEEPATDQLQRIKFLALRSLAELLARRPGGAPAALAAYCAATEVDGDDTALWNRLGSLVRGLRLRLPRCPALHSCAPVAFCVLGRPVLHPRPHPACAPGHGPPAGRRGGVLGGGALRL